MIIMHDFAGLNVYLRGAKFIIRNIRTITKW